MMASTDDSQHRSRSAPSGDAKDNMRTSTEDSEDGMMTPTGNTKGRSRSPIGEDTRDGQQSPTAEPHSQSAGSKSPTPTPPAPAPQKCIRCGETRPVDEFARSWKPHLELMTGWRECNRCTWVRKSMVETEFERLYQNPNVSLIIDSNLTVPFTKCKQCEGQLPSRAFVRGLYSTIPATAKQDTCNTCCLKNGDMVDESVVEYPIKTDGPMAESRKCIVCFQMHSPEYYIRSNDPYAPVIPGWLSCNHCSMRRSGLVASIFAYRYHGEPPKDMS